MIIWHYRPLHVLFRAILFLVAITFDLSTAQCGLLNVLSYSVAAKYTKHEYRIPMRDGKHLFTSVYVPRDATTGKKYPILLTRTCYSVAPYGESAYHASLGPNRQLQREGFIFVYQDVRGAFMSEGTFVNMRPHIATKRGNDQIDESSDTFDTIQWLLQHITHHNGRVGMWGISYPGFYAATGMIDAHPALKAVSPQAPIADWWCDDFHHQGAFFLPHSFNFIVSFGQPRKKLTKVWPPRFQHGTRDGYQFFMDLGPLKNANPRYLHDRVAMWNNLVAHPNYDEFWKSRNILPHLKHVAPAVLIVGGWFDAEDLYGPLHIYASIEAANPSIKNMLVMGPWSHGGWARGQGDHLGNIDFGSATSQFFQTHIESKFFNKYLKDRGESDLPEAFVFETGRNQWRQFDHWPPHSLAHHKLYLGPKHTLALDHPPKTDGTFDQFSSDPNKPVPFINEIAIGMTKSYMTDDQRFAARHPGVLVYQTDLLDHDLTLCGPLVADLHVSTSQTDADWIVKLIDVLPPDTKDNRFVRPGEHLGGYQMMVRSEVIRGRFRNDPATPMPMAPNKVTRIRLPLQDVLHTFRKGHRVMIQIQSSWFPLVDRNPQKFVDNIFLAEPTDFVAAIHRVYHSSLYASHLDIGILPQTATP